MNTTKNTAVAMVAGLALFLLPLAGAQVGAKKTGDPRVERLLKESDLKYSVDEDGDFRLLNGLPDKRSQLVWILSNTNNLGTLEIRQIWSVGYMSDEPLPARIANRLLEQNAKVKLGGWHVRKMNGKYAAVFSAQVAADTDKLALLLALNAVTTTADEMELELTGKDDY